MSEETKEKKLSRVAMLRKHGIHIARTTAVAFANAFPGPIKNGSIPRRGMLALCRKGWCVPLSESENTDGLLDHEITPAGLVAVKKIAAAEEEYKSQRKRRGAIQHA